MARRRLSRQSPPTGGMSTQPAPHPWPNLQALIEDEGSFVVGRVPPIPCAAIASDEHNMLAALVGRRGESLPELLERLESAVAKAYGQEIYTDEINGQAADNWVLTGRLRSLLHITPHTTAPATLAEIPAEFHQWTRHPSCIVFSATRAQENCSSTH